METSCCCGYHDAVRLLGGIGKLIVDIYEWKKAYISTLTRQRVCKWEGYTCGSLFDVLKPVVDGLLGGVDITLLAGL